MSVENPKSTVQGSFIPLSPTMSDDDKRSISGHGIPSSESLGHLSEAPGRLTPTGQGRIKAPPVCCAPSLKRSASSIVDLNGGGVCYSAEEAAACAAKSFLARRLPMTVDGNAPLKFPTRDISIKAADVKPITKSYVSSSSTVVTNTSVSTHGQGQGGDSGSTLKREPPVEIISTDATLNSDDEHSGVHPPTLSSSFKDKLLKEKNSRQGREKQRWLVHTQTESLVRQVAGCIPITKDGRIILISASRKMEWILPKGGWDTDETVSECAVRETFEEGGILGALGGGLEPVDYETRKSKKRRSGKESEVEGSPEDVSAKDRKGLPPLPKRFKVEDGSPLSSIFPPLTSAGSESWNKAPQIDSSPMKESPSKLSSPGSSETAKYNFVRMFLFPMYVSDVKDDWPEKGRLRKLVDIDEAIAIMEKENRTYFRTALLQVKARGLHLIRPETSDENEGKDNASCTEKG
ncbi:hypothetical protein ACHAXS_010377 [Conticribra weissflogii]